MRAKCPPFRETCSGLTVLIYKNKSHTRARLPIQQSSTGTLVEELGPTVAVEAGDDEEEEQKAAATGQRAQDQGRAVQRRALSALPCEAGASSPPVHSKHLQSTFCLCQNPAVSKRLPLVSHSHSAAVVHTVSAVVVAAAGGGGGIVSKWRTQM